MPEIMKFLYLQPNTSKVQFNLSISIWDTLYNIHTTYMNALPFYSSLGYRRSGRQFDEDEVYSGTSTTQQGKLDCISLSVVTLGDFTPIFPHIS